MLWQLLEFVVCDHGFFASKYLQAAVVGENDLPSLPQYFLYSAQLEGNLRVLTALPASLRITVS
jgi:hypothetical protein